MAPLGRVLIAHGDSEARAYVRSLADGRPRLGGPVEADSFDALLACIREEPRVALVIVDRDLPGMSSDLILRSLPELRDVPVAVLTGDLTHGKLESLSMNGNEALVPMQLPEEPLVGIIGRILAAVDGPAPRKRNSAQPADRKLTGRQQDVLRLISEGCSNRDISELLGIAEGTVKVHVNAVFRLLGVHNRVSATLAFRRTLQQEQG
jgi:DNA-binding NarL/FixJ family response regulator